MYMQTAGIYQVFVNLAGAEIFARQQPDTAGGESKIGSQDVESARVRQTARWTAGGAEPRRRYDCPSGTGSPVRLEPPAVVFPRCKHQGTAVPSRPHQAWIAGHDGGPPVAGVDLGGIHGCVAAALESRDIDADPALFASFSMWLFAARCRLLLERPPGVGLMYLDWTDWGYATSPPRWFPFDDRKVLNESLVHVEFLGQIDAVSPSSPVQIGPSSGPTDDEAEGNPDDQEDRLRTNAETALFLLRDSSPFESLGVFVSLLEDPRDPHGTRKRTSSFPAVQSAGLDSESKYQDVDAGVEDSSPSPSRSR
ncbi:hypothetical protein N7492_002120 [Penicillium capsulatum]|uniref:Uncharacterized protein n=1 Tax=Penicillium capsulatum TaxID=69766 RepID=A0A9W9II04_9EURO|nr:hypothetical protein N7492_002120 [Penicillium capsulatum]